VKSFSKQVLLILASFLLIAVGLSVPEKSQAANPAEFDPGYIISDQYFFDKNSMTAIQIQQFLNQRVPRCTLGDSGKPAGGIYTWPNGTQTRLAAQCLRDFTDTIPSLAGDRYCAAIPGGFLGAAEIIKRVSDACNISPRVLLVLLDKEQSLVSDSWPAQSQYTFATGFNCPDTAPCSATSSGFFKQVYAAARQFQVYTQNPTASGFNYRIGNNNIQYHPNDSCGSSQVVIRNQATANLYIYTPYQPNASAMANLYGTGDSCGAYGNRNFWRMYSDWFGSPTGSIPLNGAFDSATGRVGFIDISGWSLDPTTSASTFIWVNVNGAGGPYRADKPLTWIEQLFPGLGPNHGFSVSIPASAGNHQVCVYGTNSRLLGCRNVTVPAAVPVSPAGSFDSVQSSATGMQIKGWSLDKNSSESTFIWVDINGSGFPARASLPLSWIDRLFPGVGPNHGFDISVNRPPGNYKVCVYGSLSTLLGCKNVTVAPAPAPQLLSVSTPAGSFDSISATSNSIQVKGWSLDRSTSASTFIWINVNGVGGPARASLPLTWIDRMFPGVGPNHGFDVTLPATPGPKLVCIYGTNSLLLGCKNVVVPSASNPSPPNSGLSSTSSPAGNLDAVSTSSRSITVRGWSLDRSTSASTFIWVNVDGVGGPARASLPLTWIDRMFPGVGPNHGFSHTVSVAPGNRRVCVYGTNSILLGCRNVTVSN
jgi:hypothetical protein